MMWHTAHRTSFLVTIGLVPGSPCQHPYEM